MGLAADRFNLVVVAGDFLDLASIVPPEAQIIVVRKYLARLAAKGPLLVSSGNHDLLPSPKDGNIERAAAWLRQNPPAGLSVDGDSFARGEFLFQHPAVVGRPPDPRCRRRATRKASPHRRDHQDKYHRPLPLPPQETGRRNGLRNRGGDHRAHANEIKTPPGVSAAAPTRTLSTGSKDPRETACTLEGRPFHRMGSLSSYWQASHSPPFIMASMEHAFFCSSV